MKSKLLTLVLSLAAAATASASITLTMQFGQAYDSSNALVPDGSLWALVVDHDGGGFAGFNTGSSLAEANVATPGVADNFFTAGQSLAVGNIVGGGTIFALGAFNGTANGLTGLAIAELVFTYGVDGLAAGRNVAFYWFPGATLGGENKIGSQVGGISTLAADVGVGPMVLPPDGAAVNFGAATTGDAAGSLSPAAFTAVNLIPEPSAALLGALGALGLLRRRRN